MGFGSLSPSTCSRARLAVLAVAAACAACSGGGGGKGKELGRVTIQLIIPPASSPDSDPFDGVDTFRISVLEGGTVVQATDFDANDPLTITGLTEGTGRTVMLEGFENGGNRYSHGVTLPFDFENGADITVSMYYARAQHFDDVYASGSSPRRYGASTAAFTDGKVLIAGGRQDSLAGAPLASSEIFDYDTDSLLPAGTMTSAHAFAMAVSLGSNAVLVAGGENLAGLAVGSADVYVHDTVAGIGTWRTGIPSMAIPRKEYGAIPLGLGRAILAGGDDGGGPMNAAELFTWNGTTGAWSNAPNMQSARQGPVSFPTADGVGMICGGFDAGGAGNNYDATVDRYTWNGATVQRSSSTNDINAEIGYAGLARIADGVWMIFGGQDDAGLVVDTEILTLNGGGTDFNGNGGPDLPAVQRRGGGGSLAGGRALLLGGDSSTGLTFTPLATALTYTTSGTFAPITAAPGPTLGADVIPLPDGTALVVIDGRVTRYND